MYIVPTFYIKTYKTIDEIITIISNNTQEKNEKLLFYKDFKNNKFFIEDVTDDNNIYLKRNNIWQDEIGIKIIDNKIDRSIECKLGAGNLLRILFVLGFIVLCGLYCIMEHYFSVKFAGCIWIFVFFLMMFFITFQRTKAEKSIKSKLNSLFNY